mgnify:CR=1 FL=1
MNRYTDILSILSGYFQGHKDVCEIILNYVKLNENYIFVTDQINYLSNEYHYLVRSDPRTWPFGNLTIYYKKYKQTPFYRYILQKNKSKLKDDYEFRYN